MGFECDWDLGEPPMSYSMWKKVTVVNVVTVATLVRVVTVVMNKTKWRRRKNENGYTIFLWSINFLFLKHCIIPIKKPKKLWEIVWWIWFEESIFLKKINNDESN